MSVAEAQDRISAREFAEWIAYGTVEPFGEERADLRAGIIASTVANANSRKKFQASDFMPKFRPRAQTRDEMVNITKKLKAMLK